MNRHVEAGLAERRPRPETPRRWVYSGIGVALGLGAPAGLLLLRSVLEGAAGWPWLVAELTDQWPVYLYLTLSTVLVFGAFGRVVGALHDETRRAAFADTLTGLPNRRVLWQRLERAIVAARRDRVHLSLLIMDVDNLKGINDQGGHAAGDRALRAVGDAVRSVCRGADLPARISGDEFAILSLGRDAQDARALAERVRDALAADPGAPRVSIGVAAYPRVGDADASALLGAADAALYVAKTTGRDRVVVAGRADEG